MSDYTGGDRVRHERYGLGTVMARAEQATGYGATSPPRIRVLWDNPDGGPEVSTVLKANLSPTTEVA